MPAFVAPVAAASLSSKFAAAAPYIAAASAVVSGVAAIQQGRQAKATGRAQAQAFEQQGVRDRQIAEQEEDDFRRRVRRLQSTSTARLGGSGITGAGSPLLVAEDLAAEAELQAQRIRTGGLTEEARASQNAAFARFGGDASGRAGFVRAGGQLLSGLGQVDFGGGASRPRNPSNPRR